MSMRHFFLGDLVLLFSIVAWGRPYGFSDFVRELNSRSSSHLMIVKISKSVRGMYVSKFKKVFMVGEIKSNCYSLIYSSLLRCHPTIATSIFGKNPFSNFFSGHIFWPKNAWGHQNLEFFWYSLHPNGHRQVFESNKNFSSSPSPKPYLKIFFNSFG